MRFTASVSFHSSSARVSRGSQPQDGGVVHQDVDARRVRQHRFGESAASLATAQVRDNLPHATALVPDPLRGRRELGRNLGGDEDEGTFPGESRRHGATQPPTRARDQGHPTFENAEAHQLIPRSK